MPSSAPLPDREDVGVEQDTAPEATAPPMLHVVGSPDAPECSDEAPAADKPPVDRRRQISTALLIVGGLLVLVALILAL